MNGETQEAEQPTTDPIDQAAATFAKLGFEGAARELAKTFGPDEYDRVRIALAKRLGVRTSTLDRAYDHATKATDKNGKDSNGQGQPLEIEDPELWPEPVDGQKLIESLINTIESYLVLPEGAALAIALWVVHAHAFRVFYHSPRLNITAAQKDCGKSTVLDVLEPLLPRAQRMDSMTTAVFFRLAEQFTPSFLIDEYDTFLPNNEELRGALNAGHKRGGRFPRCEGDQHEVRVFNVFCPVALAGIKGLPGTLADRSSSSTCCRR